MPIPEFDIYASLWAKYIPVIRILLKRSLTSEQTLALNVADFRRAGMTRKSGYKFHIILNNGKPSNVIVDLPVASALMNIFRQDAMLQQLFASNTFQISLSSSFQLTMKHIPTPVLETVMEEQAIPA